MTWPMRHARGAGFAAAALGTIALAVATTAGEASSALALLAAAWLFAASISAGGVALSASLRLSGARWADGVFPIADACAGFFAPAYAILVLLILTLPAWAPQNATGGFGWLLARELFGTGALFVTGRRYVARSMPGRAIGNVVYLLLYAATLSSWAVDLVPAPRSFAPSTIVPLYFFLGAYLGGIAWTSLVSSIRAEEPPPVRHDLGKLLFGVVNLWAYLLWSAYLPTWYGNLPAETAALTARWAGGYKIVSIGVLIAVFALPFWLLLPAGTKRGRATLAAGAATVLLGLLGERFLLVLPAARVRGGPPTWLAGICQTVAILGLFSIGFQTQLQSSSARPVADATRREP